MKRRNAGSKRQCLIFTGGSSAEVAGRLSKLVGLHAVPDSNLAYFPKGKPFPDEAKLGETKGLLRDHDRTAVTDWWLSVKQHGGRRANTPNWDIASTCTIGSLRGVILVEAKAHHGELETSGKPDGGNADNDRCIRAAISQANGALEGITSGWKLTADKHYQLCNRFAWGWKLASLGVPTVLVYLGFLNVQDMPKYRVFKTEQEWSSAMLQHAEGIVPRDSWGKELYVNGTPLIPLIKSWPAAQGREKS